MLLLLRKWLCRNSIRVKSEVYDSINFLVGFFDLLSEDLFNGRLFHQISNSRGRGFLLTDEVAVHWFYCE